jgi:predicted transcriptional regulator
MVQYMKAMLLARSKEVRDDGSIVEVVIWELPAPLSPSVHSYKYRLFYGTPAEERVRYDNERGKGDHRHCGGKEEGYAFCHPRSTARRLRKRPTRLEHDMKAIIEVAKAGSAVRAARQQLAASRGGEAVDFRLSFESARSLFADLTPARVDLLDTLRRVGPCSVYALSKAAGRNYSNVHTDVARLEVLGLVERTDEGSVSVPYEAVEILVPLAQAA